MFLHLNSSWFLLGLAVNSILVSRFTVACVLKWESNSLGWCNYSHICRYQNTVTKTDISEFEIDRVGDNWCTVSMHVWACSGLVGNDQFIPLLIAVISWILRVQVGEISTWFTRSNEGHHHSHGYIREFLQSCYTLLILLNWTVHQVLFWCLFATSCTVFAPSICLLHVQFEDLLRLLVCLGRQWSHLDCLQDISWAWIIEQNTFKYVLLVNWCRDACRLSSNPCGHLHVVMWYREIILSIVAFLLFHKMQPSTRSSNFGKSGCPLELVIVVVLLGRMASIDRLRPYTQHTALPWSSGLFLWCGYKHSREISWYFPPYWPIFPYFVYPAVCIETLHISYHLWHALCLKASLVAEQTTKRAAVSSSWSSASSSSIFMSSSTYHFLTSSTCKWYGGSCKLSMLTLNVLKV